MIEAVNSGAAATEDIRETLAVSKAIGAKFQAFQSAAAAMVAARERHGDGGAAVLAQSVGVSRRQAGAQVRTNEMLKSMPVARGAVESGEMSFENARRLADAAAKTGAGAVEADEGLLAQAVALGEDDFAKSARRWALRQQADGGEADYARRRARRYVRFWDADGMVHLKGEFDPLTGRRIQHRLEADARRALRLDRQRAAVTGTARMFAQCMADTLQDITLNASHCAHTHNTGSGGGVGERSHNSPRVAEGTPNSKSQPAARPEIRDGGVDHASSDHGQIANAATNAAPNGSLGSAADSRRANNTANGFHDGPHAEALASDDQAFANNAADGTRDGYAESTMSAEHASITPDKYNHDPASAVGCACVKGVLNNDGGSVSVVGCACVKGVSNGDDGDLGLMSGCERAKGGLSGGVVDPASADSSESSKGDSDGLASAAGCEGANVGPSAAGGRGVEGVGHGGCGPKRPSVRAQVAVVAHLDAAQSKLVGELAGGEPLPASVLEELLCNAEAFGVLFSDRGTPLWQGNKKRFADDNLMRALIARDGACVGCGAHHVICEGHHIEPVSHGGRTDIDNMVLACGRCHHRVHHDGWQVVVYPDRYSIEPPQRVHHGPAHAPERASLFRRAQPDERTPDALFADEVIDRDTHRRLLEGARAALRASRDRQPSDTTPS